MYTDTKSGRRDTASVPIMDPQLCPTTATLRTPNLPVRYSSINSTSDTKVSTERFCRLSAEV